MEPEPQFDPANLYCGSNGGFHNPRMQRGISPIGEQGTAKMKRSAVRDSLRQRAASGEKARE
jgi:hypothetical protein